MADNVFELELYHRKKADFTNIAIATILGYEFPKIR
jgi:hypothetical protein